MQIKGNIDSVFSYALRFNPDFVDLTDGEFCELCYIQLLRRVPEAEASNIKLDGIDTRANYIGTILNSIEFSGSFPLSDDILARICQSVGWRPHNSAFHHALRYLALTALSYGEFTEKLVFSLGKNSVSRAEIVHAIENQSDVALMRSLLDGMVDISSEFLMALVEINDLKSRLARLEESIPTQISTSETGVNNSILTDSGSIDR